MGNPDDRITLLYDDGNQQAFAMRQRPLIFLVGAFILGILVARMRIEAIWFTFILFLVSVVAFALRRNVRLGYFTLFTTFTFMGVLSTLYSLHPSKEDASQFIGSRVLLIGRVEAEPEIYYAPISDEPETSRFILNVEGAILDTPQGEKSLKVTGRTAISLSLYSKLQQTLLPPDTLPNYGDKISLQGQLFLPDNARNPGGFDYRAYLARNGIFSSMRIRQPEYLQIISRDGWRNPFRAAAFWIRNRTQETARRFLSARDAAVFTGILISARGAIPVALEDNFERTGTIHILATSGMNVAMVTWLVLRFLRFCRVARRPALLATILLVLLYVVMAGERASVMRAGLVAILYLVGELLDREATFTNTLAFSAFLILLLNPLQLYDPGFQMSYLTVITIVLLMPFATKHIQKWEEQVPAYLPAAASIRFLLRQSAVCFFLALTAQIGVAPLIVCYFYEVSLVSILTNMIVVPLVFFVLAIGMGFLIAAILHPWLAFPFALVLKPLVEFIVATVTLFASIPYSCWHTPPIPLPLVILYYLLIWSSVWDIRNIGNKVIRRFVSPRQKAAIVSAVCIPLLFLGTILQPDKINLTITFLDVGQGDACVIESPSGKTFIVDTGNLLEDVQDDMGRRVLYPYLRYRGINNVEMIALTHPHADHIGGTISLLQRFHVATLLDNGEPSIENLVHEIGREARRYGTSVRVARANQTLDFGDGVKATILAPTEEAVLRGDTNNASIVLRLTYGKTSVLLTGDAEEKQENELVAAGGELKCDILKVAHHGSRTSSTTPFLQKAKPDLAVMSLGRRNTYGHPSPEVVQRFGAFQTKLFRTDISGAVVFVSDGVRFRQVEWRSP